MILDVVFSKFMYFSFTITLRQKPKGVTHSRRRTGSLSACNSKERERDPEHETHQLCSVNRLISLIKLILKYDLLIALDVLLLSGITLCTCSVIWPISILFLRGKLRVDAILFPTADISLFCRLSCRSWRPRVRWNSAISRGRLVWRDKDLADLNQIFHIIHIFLLDINESIIT